MDVMEAFVFKLEGRCLSSAKMKCRNNSAAETLRFILFTGLHALSELSQSLWVAIELEQLKSKRRVLGLYMDEYQPGTPRDYSTVLSFHH